MDSTKIRGSVKKKVLERIDKRVVSLLREMVKIPSVNPNTILAPKLPVEENNEQKIAEFLSEEMKKMGLEVRMLQAEKYRPNVIGKLKGEGDGPSLLFNGHIDTVPVEGMERDPFDAEIINGKLYGRGAADMKGGVASMIMAANAIVEANIGLRGDLIIAAVADEEDCGKLGTQFTLERGVKAEAVIVTEPTKLQIAVAHKGLNFFEILTYGKSAHGSDPTKGINAIEKMAKIILALKRELPKRWITKKHELLGGPTINIGSIEGGIQPNAVPGLCKISVDRRLIPSETIEESFREIEEILEGLKKDDRELSYEIKPEMRAYKSPLLTSPDERIVTVLREETKYLTGTDPSYTGVPYGTDGPYYREKGIPTVICGPGDVSLGHSSKEYVEVEQILFAAKLYALAALSYCGVVD